MGRPCSCAVTTCSASARSRWTRCSRAMRWCGRRARAARQRGDSRGVATVGRGALEKLAGRQRPDVEVETVRFRAQLERALAGDAEPPRLELRGADGELRTDEGNH